jgi:hypothetical protein
MLGPKFPKKEWDIDEYIILPPEKINWNNLPKVERRFAVTKEDGTTEYMLQEIEMTNDEKKYDLLLTNLLNSSAALESEVLTSTNYGCIGDTTCKWCHEHWMGNSGVLLILPNSECNRKKWAKFCSLKPKKLGDILQKKTGTTRLDT